MTSLVPYINGMVTLTEIGFNLLGYLPRGRYAAINDWSTTWRFRFGSLQMITGTALYALGLLVEMRTSTPEPKKYLTLAQQMVSLGILYCNHGIFNIVRSYAERYELGILLGAYDFYGRKILTPLSPSCDLQGMLFEKIRRQFDRILFVTLFPPKISLRA